MLLSDAEWKVMNAVWGHDPASVRDVLERVEPQTDWAYTTVKTMLERLVEKGALSAEKRANTTYFTPCVCAWPLAVRRLRALVNKAFDGAVGPLLHCLLSEKKLSDADQAELRRLLESEAGPSRPSEPAELDRRSDEGGSQ